jgi:haloalkane dehalogenase
VTDAVRVPDELLEGLPGFPFAAHYREREGLRLAHVDDGDGAPVLFLHGEPTWSYLWRKAIPPVRDAGFRCVAPDMAGFGRSDKPVDIGWYTYDRHCALIADLLEHLDLRDCTFVLHDWGGPIGLRVAVENPDRVSKLVLMDTGVWTGRQKMSEAWHMFRDFVERTEDLPVSLLVRRACKTDPGDEIAAAYDAPYPNVESKAGARAFPLIVPWQEDNPDGEKGRRVLEALADSPRPTLLLWADSDPILPVKAGERLAERIKCDPPEVIPDASHFLQEDQGELIGTRIAEWLKACA